MSVNIRISTINDAKILFKWRNDELVRQNSFNQSELKYEDHYKWYESFLKDKLCKCYIIVADGCDVGQIKARVVDNEAEIGYSIGKEFRGHGYGTKILELAKEQIAIDFPNVKTIIGRVKVDNEISMRAFKKAGYEKCFVQYMSKIGGVD